MADIQIVAGEADARWASDLSDRLRDAGFDAVAALSDYARFRSPKFIVGLVSSRTPRAALHWLERAPAPTHVFKLAKREQRREDLRLFAMQRSEEGVRQAAAVVSGLVKNAVLPSPPHIASSNWPPDREHSSDAAWEFVLAAMLVAIALFAKLDPDGLSMVVRIATELFATLLVFGVGSLLVVGAVGLLMRKARDGTLGSLVSAIFVIAVLGVAFVAAPAWVLEQAARPEAYSRIAQLPVPDGANIPAR